MYRRKIVDNIESSSAFGKAINDLHRLLGFRLFTFIVIIDQFPLIMVPIRGYYGYGILIAMVYFLNFIGPNSGMVTRNLRSNIKHNKWLVFFMFWYVGGVIFNTLFRGNGLIDWIWWIYPILMIFLLGYGLLFLHDKQCLRFLQLSFTIIIGIQCLYSSLYMIRFPDIARTLTYTGWVYGNQHTYAVYAMMLPVLLWRSFKETILLRLVLLVSLFFILLTVLISGFATPIALILFGIFLFSVFSLLVPIKDMQHNGKIKFVPQFLMSVILITMSAVFYNNTVGMSYFDGSYSRISTFINDPASGGYNEYYASIGSRTMLAEKSFDLFLSNPLFGDGGSPRYNLKQGGHSSFFDTLACYGILGGGGALICMVLFIVGRAVKRYRLKRDWETLVGLITSLMLVFAGIANPYWEFDAIPFVILMTGILLRDAEEHLENNRKPGGDVNTLPGLSKNYKYIRQ